VRGQAIALATLANFSSNFAVSLALPPLRAAAGPAATYFFFAAVGVLAVVVIDRAVPETKGKSLEEIEAMWGERGE
jgi:SP family arabinose:H+ symporter-like MFS transporter